MIEYRSANVIFFLDYFYHMALKLRFLCENAKSLPYIRDVITDINT